MSVIFSVKNDGMLILGYYDHSLQTTKKRGLAEWPRIPLIIIIFTVVLCVVWTEVRAMFSFVAAVVTMAVHLYLSHLTIIS